MHKAANGVPLLKNANCLAALLIDLKRNPLCCRLKTSMYIRSFDFPLTSLAECLFRVSDSKYSIDAENSVKKHFKMWTAMVVVFIPVQVIRPPTHL